jgi:tetratricopeptide (TPR) repeat protein
MDEEAINRFRELLSERRFDEALELLQSIIRAKPDDWNATYLCGFVLRSKGDLQGALRYYKRALAINSADDAVHHALGVAYQQLGDYPSAIASFETALALRPNRVESLNSLGLTLKLAGRYGEALRYYEKAMDVCADSAFQETLKNQGRYFAFEDAADERVFRLRPEYFKVMRELLATDLNYFVLAGNLAACYEEMGDHRKAQEFRHVAETCTPVDADLIGPIKRWGNMFG